MWPELLALEDRRLPAMVVTVTSPDDHGPGTLRDAVEQADGANQQVEILFALQEGSTIALTSGQLELSNAKEPVDILGPGADRLTIDGTKSSRIFQIDSGVTASITGLTLANGAAGGDYEDGGDLSNDGTLTLTGIVVRGGTAYAGGDIANFGSSDLVDCTITGGTANRGAGLFNGGPGTATLKDCRVTGNTGVPGPGLAYASLGGGMFNFGSLSMTGGSITDNSSYRDGALYSGGPTNLTRVTIQGNPGRFETIFNNGVPMTMIDCTVSGDPSTSTGGSYAGINNFYYTGRLDLTDCTIEGFRGGGIVNGSTLDMTRCRIINNTGGDGLENRYGYSNASLTDCTISGNTGGGIGSNGTMTATGCTISDNTSPGRGGGLFNGGQGTLTDCTVSGNTAAQGGGIVSYGGLSLVACTVSRNSATTAGGGGGLYVAGSTATLTDTIVAGNKDPRGPSDIAGAGAVTGSYNLIGTGGSGGLLASDHNLLNVADPGLTPLGDYGGPIETIALQPGSPARHAGTAVPGVITDQRGLPLDSPVDIGAFQSQPGPLAVDTAIDGLGSPRGELSLRQAVNLADVLDGGSTIVFDKAAFAGKSTVTLTAGQLELSNTTGPVKVLGPGLAKLAVSGGGSSRVFQVDPGATASLSGLTVTGGATAGDGGGLLNRGTLALAGVAVVGNAAADGGGLANFGTATVLGTSIDRNTASANGGGVYNAGSLLVALTDLSGNMAAGNGGGLYNSGKAALLLCDVEGNSAGSGGGIFADPAGSPVALLGTTVKKNKGGDISGRVTRL
jgi:fibronectin-binding autotransporter adhesin